VQDTLVINDEEPRVRSGLKVFARLDEGSNPDKVTVSDAELEAANLRGHPFHLE
jgi:hypothetical protein